MSEIKSLNLSGGYDPMRSVDRESYADKVRKNSQGILKQAMGMYQMQAAQNNIENQRTMKRADEYFGKNMNKFMSSSANIKDPKSWTFNTGDTREKAFNEYKEEVGGNYSAFNEAWAQKQQAESQALTRSFIDWRAEVGDDAEFQKIYSNWVDELPESAKNNLMSNASQDLYGSLNSMYIPEEDREGFLEKYGTATRVGGLLISSPFAYQAGKRGVKGAQAILEQTRKDMKKPPSFERNFGENVQEQAGRENRVFNEARKPKDLDPNFKKPKRPMTVTESIKSLFSKEPELGKRMNVEIKKLPPGTANKPTSWLKKTLKQKEMLSKVKKAPPHTRRAVAKFLAKAGVNTARGAGFGGWVGALASLGFTAYEAYNLVKFLAED